MDISGNTQKVRKPMKSVFEKIIEKLEEQKSGLAEWARLYGIKYHCFYARWKKNQNPEYLFRGYRRVDND